MLGRGGAWRSACRGVEGCVQECVQGRGGVWGGVRAGVRAGVVLSAMRRLRCGEPRRHSLGKARRLATIQTRGVTPCVPSVWCRAGALSIDRAIEAGAI